MRSTCALILLCAVGVTAVSQAGEKLSGSSGDGNTLSAIQIGTPTRLVLHPESVSITGRRQRARWVVTGHYPDGEVRDLTRVATFRVEDESIAEFVPGERGGGALVPRGEGSTQLYVECGGQQATASLSVSGQRVDEEVSFFHGTLAALTKQGCNSGGCHGSPSGKGGFRLSLRGYDPELDQQTLIREQGGRRTNRMEPEKSLVLLKPTARVAHGGGKRLDESDPAYGLIRDWIAAGCRVPESSPRCEKIEVYPPERILRAPAEKQQLVVRAYFSDGTVRDVSDLAVYSSSEDAIATVDEDGFVASRAAGEVAILVQYLELAETARLTFLRDVPGFVWEPPSEHNYVDRFVFAKLQQMQIAPANLAPDHVFVRRLHLDLIGRLPTASETETFLSSSAADKRDRLIDELLETSEFAQFWATRWGDLLRVNNKKMSVSGVHKFHRWIVKAVEENMPYDRFVRELLTSEGSTFSRPASNYYRAPLDTSDMTETTAQIFMGVRIQCAKCHNHPFEQWTQDNYYGLSAFFNRVERKKVQGQDELMVWVAREGEVTQPRTGRTMKPWLPLVGELDLQSEHDQDRRVALVDWLTASDNPFFTRMEVNRIWSYVMGRGIVDPIDDFRDSNPPANPELLDALAADFVEQGFDRRHVIRTILRSRTYQSSATANQFNERDQKYFSRYAARMLSAEQLLEAISQFTGVPEIFAGLPSGTRATQLPSPSYGKDFLKVFGKPLRDTACECERASRSDLARVMELVNGPLVFDKVQAKENVLSQLIEAGRDDREIVEHLYLTAYARGPKEKELKTALDYVQGVEDRREALEDLAWTLINSKEFLFQH